jgi:hypothetical protein
MPGTKDYSLDDENREEWDRIWGAMPHRRLTSAPRVGTSADLVGHLGSPASATISEDPPQFCARVWRPSECCPVCGAPTTGTERLPATLHPRWENGLSLGFGVWVHRACFETCPDAGEPTPVPW